MTNFTEELDYMCEQKSNDYGLITIGTLVFIAIVCLLVA